MTRRLVLTELATAMFCINYSGCVDYVVVSNYGKIMMSEVTKIAKNESSIRQETRLFKPSQFIPAVAAVFVVISLVYDTARNPQSIRELTMFSDEIAAPVATDQTQLSQMPSGRSTINLANYESIQNGMSLEQVEKILGKSTQISQIAISGFPEIVVYQWQEKGADGANINVLLQGNEVINKAQFGLK